MKLNNKAIIIDTIKLYSMLNEKQEFVDYNTSIDGGIIKKFDSNLKDLKNLLLSSKYNFFMKKKLFSIIYNTKDNIITYTANNTIASVPHNKDIRVNYNNPECILVIPFNIPLFLTKISEDDFTLFIKIWNKGGYRVNVPLYYKNSNIPIYMDNQLMDIIQQDNVPYLLLISNSLNLQNTIRGLKQFITDLTQYTINKELFIKTHAFFRDNLEKVNI